MDYQKLFNSTYIYRLKNGVINGNSVEEYFHDRFSYDNNQILTNINIEVEAPKLLLPNDKQFFDFENSKSIFEAYHNLTPLEATDERIWTYLTHTEYWNYMKKRRPIELQAEEKRINYILRHWFIKGLSATNLLRNDISLLWWVAYMTYDDTRENPYELTEEAFSMLDYTRHLLPGVQGRNKNFAHGLLQFVIENKPLFEDNKEAKVRFLMRKSNFIAGYKIFASLTGDEIKNSFNKYVDEMKTITSFSTKDEVIVEE